MSEQQKYQEEKQTSPVLEQDKSAQLTLYNDYINNEVNSFLDFNKYYDVEVIDDFDQVDCLEDQEIQAILESYRFEIQILENMDENSIDKDFAEIKNHLACDFDNIKNFVLNCFIVAEYCFNKIDI